MVREIVAYVKLQVQGGAATPSGTIGPALGSKGVNIMEFCKQFNARTQDKKGELLPVLLTIYNNKSFNFIIKTPPAPSLLMKKAKVTKGAAEPNRKKVGEVTWDEIAEIASLKMTDLNAFTLPAAASMIAGTARSMGLSVTGENPFKQLNTVSHG